MYEIENQDVFKNFGKYIFLVIILAERKYYDDLNTLPVGKMKNKTKGVTTKQFVGLKPKIYSLLVYNCSEHQKKKEYV